MNPSETKLMVGVCTRGDSQMLRDLLGELLLQVRSLPPSAEVGLVVNSSDFPSKDFSEYLESLEASGDFFYVYEPRRGIPFARNRALDESYKRHFHWLAFIDDDCFPENAWLATLMNEALERKLDAVMGGFSIVPVGVKSKWLPRTVFGPKSFARNGVRFKSGSFVPSAITRSVLFDVSESSVVRTSNLRFDERLFEVGGSDTQFFNELTQKGGRILYTEESQVTEFYSGERLTLRWHFMRKLRYSQNEARRHEARLTGITRNLLRTSIAGLTSKSIFEFFGMMALKISPLVGLLIYPIYRYREYRLDK